MYRWILTDSDQEIGDYGHWLRNGGIMEHIGGSKTLFALGSVVTAVGHDGCNLIVEVVLCLVRPEGIMRMASWE